MYLRARFAVFALLLSISLASHTPARAQSLTSGTISGKVTDPTGAVIPGARVQIENPVSGFKLSTATDSSGTFGFANVPFNPVIGLSGFVALTAFGGLFAVGRRSRKAKLSS